MFKFVVLCAVLAVANAGNLYASAPVLAYSAAPAVSHVTYGAPLVKTAYAAAPALGYARYAAPAVHYAAAAPVAVHAPAVGTTHQSTVRSLDGNSAVSHYSKAVDTAFSSVRKYDTRITNDAKFVAPVAYTTPVHYASPAVQYAAAAPIVKTSYAAPAFQYAAPAVHYASPVVKTAYSAPALSYAPSGVVAHTTFSGLGASYAW